MIGEKSVEKTDLLKNFTKFNNFKTILIDNDFDYDKSSNIDLNNRN